MGVAIACSASSPRWPRARLRRRALGAAKPIMAGAVLCMAFYNVWSRPFMLRSSPLGFLASAWARARRRSSCRRRERPPRRARAASRLRSGLAGVYLGVGGGARGLHPLGLALQRTTPTLVANTMTVNPIAAALLATAIGRRADHARPRPGARRSVCRNMDRNDDGKLSPGAPAQPQHVARRHTCIKRQLTLSLYLSTRQFSCSFANE